MAAKYMRIKEIVIPFLTLVILLSQLSGCAVLSPSEVVEESQKGEEVVIEYADKDNQTDDLTQAISNVKQSETKETLTNEELIKVFEEAYSIVLEVQGNDDYSIEIDYMAVEEIVDNLYPTKKLPADYKERYIEWRPIDDADHSDKEANQLFTEVNETMYVTSTVNIRESYSVESTKLGTLSRGQSVTRIGIGISNSEADGWSKVILSDGREVYVSSDCLSATKPSTSSNSSTSSKNNGTSGSESQQGNSGNTSGGSNYYNPDPKDLPGYTEPEEMIPYDPSQITTEGYKPGDPKFS